MLKTLPESILSLIYPQECKICSGEVESSDDGVACSACWSQTKIFNGNETLCKKCGAFLFADGSDAATVCRRCDEHHYDQVSSIGSYERALAATVLHLKRIPHAGRRVRQLLISAFERMAIDTDSIIVPVPLSARRLRERGFNQAAILAWAIRRHTGMPIDEQTLVRKIHTPMHRAGMDRKARAMTVKRVFAVVRPRLVEGRSILLVDDVFTSGATASICAEVLKKNGASTVNVLTVARAE